VTLSEGRRTSLAVVPPPARQRAEVAEEISSGSSVHQKLRELVDPDYSAARVMRGGTYSPGARLPNVPERGTTRKQAEHSVFQTGIQTQQGGNGVNLAAQARLSADQRYLRVSVNPVFQTANGQGASVNLPLIPGAANP